MNNSKQQEQKRKIEKIVDFSTLRKKPQRLPFHWAYVLFFALAVTSSLWQHGHPVYTLIALGLIVPLGMLAYVPYRHFSSSGRFYFQLILIVASGIWFVFRIKHNIPVDKVLIESVCLTGLCFVMAQRSADYDYLFLISIFLLLYGALLPRAIFVLVFGVAFIMAAFLLYSTRLKSLSKQADLPNPARIFRRNWPLYLLHFITAASVFWYVFSMMPTEDRGGEGLFSVSFRTANDSILPPEFQKWFFKPKVKKSTKGKLIVKTGKPTSIGKKGPRIRLKKGEYMSSSGDGGSSPPGKEIIFRVKSPIKLYWLAQLYDSYDGQNWILTDELKNARASRTRRLESKVMHHNVEQNFIMENWISPKLYSAYRPSSFDTFTANQKIIRLKINSFGASLMGQEYPPLPFRYTVTSTLYLPEINKELRKSGKYTSYWIENVRRKHYLMLPRIKLSRRLKLLAKRLTDGITDPYKKALRIRNYLRDNFKYQQFAKKVPPGREAVDYFLFELREGHCEYYASSMAVLARLCGIPARIATGFSPGNYNALNKHFEVHAYHAHAWTQVFIDGMGWLTFDATPPGQIVSHTTPFGIGSLRDPFGDTWKVMPPELTRHTLEYIREAYFEKLERDRSEKELTIAEKALMEAALAPEKAKEKVKSLLDYAFPKVKGEGKSKFQNMLKKIQDGWRDLLDKTKSRIRSASAYLVKNWQLLIPVLAIFFAIIMEIKILRRYLNRRRLLANSHKLYLKAQEHLDKDSAATVRYCYQAVRNLLNLAGLPRKKNLELLDYGASLDVINWKLRKNTVVIFFLYSKQEYSLVPCTDAEAKEALNRTQLIREFIYPKIHESGELEK
jgi:hypothetical protein